MIARTSCLVLAMAGAVSCARAPSPDAAPPASASTATPAPPAAGEAAAAAAASSSAPVAAAPAPPAVEAPAPLPDLAGGVDFIEQARLLFRVAACGPGAGDLPVRFDAAVVAKHCDELARAYAEYKRGWVDVAMPFLASLRPRGLPSNVVYPFGGGDLVSALATFPDATEITTISLEPAGDLRPIDTLPADHLSRELAAHRSHLERLLEKAHSRTDNLEKESQAELPGEIVFDLGALVVHGAEPVGLAYFRLQPDGAVHYVTQADIDAQAHHPKALRALFDNVELRFQRGSGSEDAGGANGVRILRHIAFNLDDDHLKADPALLAYLSSHLNQAGKASAMTKAASHLLWSDHFSTIRSWLIEHTDWMISDSTGIPPRFAGPAGFTQDPYGQFDGPAAFGLVNPRDANDFKRLFASREGDAAPHELAFRYGYPDRAGHAHLVVTHR
jgi:hypothetical protein